MITVAANSSDIHGLPVRNCRSIIMCDAAGVDYQCCSCNFPFREELLLERHEFPVCDLAFFHAILLEPPFETKKGSSVAIDCTKEHSTTSGTPLRPLKQATAKSIANAAALSIACEAKARELQESNTFFIRSSCNSTKYPKLCYTSLVKHATFIHKNPVLLTETALNITLSSAKSTSVAISMMARSRGMTTREVAAMQDCMEVLADSVEELRKSIGEMTHLRTSNFERTMSDVQTWVSAALTDDTTCTDGFQETVVAGDVKTIVRGRIVKVAQLTSNALALINQLANSHA
ncbi:hypothetical protein PIB30_001169 [Stylosanthes scabra]|uniref:Pectinesterase inhibitor domain-containing protein n=1 Tax=Stylosanthes scabra TaxID=79078 RepID=A0ABU6V4W7_9FABA|nr:hypothetical protein [Stylosanthes scabra]